LGYGGHQSSKLHADYLQRFFGKQFTLEYLVTLRRNIKTGDYPRRCRVGELWGTSVIRVAWAQGMILIFVDIEWRTTYFSEDG
jgi:hypothetical protein